MQNNDDPILRPKDAADYLGLSKGTLYKLVRGGELPKPISVWGRVTGIRRSHLNAFLERRADPRTHRVKPLSAHRDNPHNPALT